MSGNKNLGAAKKAKNDEFYTRREDIEAELWHYEKHFKGKTVYMNCDDPEKSEFWQFFVRNYRPWGIRKLIATHYEPNAKNFSYKLEYPEDADTATIYTEPVKTPIKSNGDFRSECCIELLKEADIVVTNPPFSLFREYIAQLVEYDKKFVIIGNKNAITYKEIFPEIKNGKLWLGYGQPGNFMTPFGETNKVNGLSRWFTNLDITKRHLPLDLRGNYYDPEKYPKYDNYDAIEVSKVNDIPIDYDGVMGVPISFLDKYCPEQFEILGLTSGRKEFDPLAYPSKRYINALQHNKDGSTSNGSKLNTRAAIRTDHPDGIYYTAENCDYKLEISYARILIRNKNPQPHNSV